MIYEQWPRCYMLLCSILYAARHIVYKVRHTVKLCWSLCADPTYVCSDHQAKRKSSDASVVLNQPGNSHLEVQQCINIIPESQYRSD